MGHRRVPLRTYLANSLRAPKYLMKTKKKKTKTGNVTQDEEDEEYEDLEDEDDEQDDGKNHLNELFKKKFICSFTTFVQQILKKTKKLKTKLKMTKINSKTAALQKRTTLKKVRKISNSYASFPE
jgi:hypothetical protein